MALHLQSGGNPPFRGLHQFDKILGSAVSRAATCKQFVKKSTKPLKDMPFQGIPGLLTGDFWFDMVCEDPVRSAYSCAFV
ncbi:hypothetical protein [Chachezhania antarctica]|uniref:hypothetical protein n=1 Tax=Chachezhania antarctica TaxID=2340860 RepID=UPI0013CE4A86|nr:hypothetical protein [Chachezhania antarctica]